MVGRASYVRRGNPSRSGITGSLRYAGGLLAFRPIRKISVKMRRTSGPQTGAFVIDWPPRCRMSEAKRNRSETGVSGLATTDDLSLAAVEWLPTSVLLVRPDGTISFANRQVEHLFGYTRTQLVGARLDRILPDSLTEHQPLTSTEQDRSRRVM